MRYSGVVCFELDGMPRPRMSRGSTWRFFALLLLAASLFFDSAKAEEGNFVRSVALSKPFFSPALGQKISIRIQFTSPVRPRIDIVDRDGFVVRQFATSTAAVS